MGLSPADASDRGTAKTDTRLRSRWGVLSCCAVALAFRIPSLSWGLPFLFHPDEPTNFSIVQRMLKQHDLNPHFFKYPSLFFYLNAIVQAAHYAVCRLLGVVHSLQDLPEVDVPIDGSGFTTLPSAFFVGRMLSTACGVGIVWVAYKIGRALSRDDRVALLAALLVAVSPGTLRDTRWLSPDALVTLAVTSTVLAALNALRSGRGKDYACAAILTGLTASLKYNGAIVGLTIPVVVFMRDGRRAFRNPWLYASPFIAALCFSLTSPYALLDLQRFRHDFLSESAHYANGHAGAEGDTLAYYSEYLLEGEGLAALFAVAGIVLGVVRRNRGVLLLGVFCAAYFAFINSFETRNGRTIVPFIPTLLVIAAWCAVKCVRCAEARLDRRHVRASLRRALVLGAVALLAGYPLAWSIQRTRPLLLKDNRQLAGEWVEANIAPHSHIAIERYACYVNRKHYALKVARNLYELEPSWLRGHVDYLIFAGDSFNRYLVDPGRYPRQARKYQRLFKEFELVHLFDDSRRGAEIRIYRSARAG
jgi:4-amino-4-deoxy-L-arabinose transferase-like glycosyltransferase